MDASAWSAQLLAEFVAVVSAASTGEAAARAAIEHAAGALDADAAAIVCGGELVAAVGYPPGGASVAELAGVRPGTADARLQVPGAGSCAAAAASLEYPPGATLVLARSAPGGLSREETGLLREMARVAAMTMRMLHVLDNERSAREEAWPAGTRAGGVAPGGNPGSQGGLSGGDVFRGGRRGGATVGGRHRNRRPV